MEDYFKKLSPVQKVNIKVILERMKQKGITNKYSQAAILAIASKESAFIPQSEKGYRKTDNNHIRRIFSVTRNLSDAKLNVLKQNDEAFFNLVYGGKYGNAGHEGFKYRGRGFNQLTFKDNYLSVGKRIGLDLVNNPDLANTVTVAADILIDFFLREFETARSKGILSRYNSTGINDFSNLKDSLNAVFQANRGWNKTGADPTGGYVVAANRVPGFLEIVSENKAAIGGSFFF